MISIITMFFAGAVASGFCQSLVSTLILTGVIVLGVTVTLLVSRLLSMTVLKGMPSSFALELPPYRVPQVGKVIVRSIFDRTLFVLGRAVVVAAPAGLLIWLMANIYIGDVSVLSHCAAFLDPFARWFGLDGVILMAFYPRPAGKRNRHANYYYDLHGDRNAYGDGFRLGATYAARQQRLDMAHSRMHHAVFADAFSLCHNVPNY